jgi:eukaryotic-like serine/threonine-protein kinase
MGQTPPNAKGSTRMRRPSMEEIGTVRFAPVSDPRSDFADVRTNIVVCGPSHNVPPATGASTKLPPPEPESPSANHSPIPDGYEIVQELGRGTFGSVYQARELALAGRLVAIKVSSQQLGESQTLARLQHPNIVPIYSIHQRGKYQVMVMPYLGSLTLAHLINDIRRTGEVPHTGKRIVSTLRWRGNETAYAGTMSPMSAQSQLSPSIRDRSGTSQIDGLVEVPVPAERPGFDRPLLSRLEKMSYVDSVLWLGAELAGGLAHAHERGILHRDIKPANVLISDDGTPMLLDFNMADDVMGSTEERQTLGGTLRYMSPEQLSVVRERKGAIDARSDIYSLGVLLYEAIAGQLPYREITPESHWSDDAIYADRLKVPADITTIRPEVSPAIASIIAKCLMPSPSHRYASAAELREDLIRQLEHRPLKFARERSLRERFRKWTVRRPRLAVSLIVTMYATIILATVIGGFTIRQRHLNSVRSEQARDRLYAARLDVQAAMSTNNAPAAQFQDVIDRVVAALNPYGIDRGSSWLDDPLRTNLPSEDQVQIREQASELMFQAAEANYLLAKRVPNQSRFKEHLDAALNWNRVACQAWPEGTPSNFLAQKARFLRAVGREAEANEAARLSGEGVRIPLSPMLEALARVQSGSSTVESIAELKKQAQSAPPRYDVWMALASAYYQRGEFESAIEAYDGAIALNPESPWISFHRGMTNLQLKRYPQALENFSRVIELRDDEPETYLNRALARMGVRDYEGAIRDLDAVEARGARFTRLYFLRSKARLMLGDKAGSATDRKVGFDATPDDPISWLTRGEYRLQEKTPNLDQVLVDFDMALELDPKYILALEKKAELLAEYRDDAAGALFCYDRILELHPTRTGPLPARAVLLARLGRKAEARAALELCRPLPKTPILCYQLASAYLRLDETPRDRDEAVALLKQTLQGQVMLAKMMPNDPDLKSLATREDFQKLLKSALIVAGQPE